MVSIPWVNAQDKPKVYNDLKAIELVPQDVQIIDLSNQHLEKFPLVILSCTNLKKLILNGTQLPSIPESIVQLVNLSTFEFNHLEKPNLEFKALPVALAQLRKLENVGLIGLPNMDWSGAMEILQVLPKLNNLAVMKNDFKALPNGIEKLTSLRQIWLGGNTELNPEEVFEKLPFIHQVGFGGSQYSVLPNNVHQARDLFNFWLAGNQLTSLLPLVGNPKLKSLSLNNNELKQLPIGITQLPLFTLLLDNNPVLDWEPTFKELAKMKSMKQLSLNNNKLSKLPVIASELSNLEVLSLRGNEFTESEKEAIKKLLPNTKVVF